MIDGIGENISEEDIEALKRIVTKISANHQKLEDSA